MTYVYDLPSPLWLRPLQVLSKGKILQLKSVPTSGTELTEIALPYSTDMAPSFRLLAYYYRGSDIVADSVWVDVKDVCKGKVDTLMNQSINSFIH